MIETVKKMKKWRRHYRIYSHKNSVSTRWGALGGVLFTQLVLADSSTKDFSLNALDDSVQAHATGDFGKLCFIIAFLWVLVNVCIGKFSWRVILTPAVILLAVGFYPAISSSIFGG